MKLEVECNKSHIKSRAKTLATRHETGVDLLRYHDTSSLLHTVEYQSYFNDIRV